MNADTNCYFLKDARPLWERVICRIFGCHPSFPDPPKWANDVLVTHVRINFSIKDRLLIALTGNASVKSWTACENRPGRVETGSHAMAAHPKFLE